MSDAYDYFREHAIAAVRKARALPPGRPKQKQRTVAPCLSSPVQGGRARAEHPSSG
ncbi:hypothetical protein ACVWZK_003457 [Bradyrhizobium sp. GM0.4]